MPTYCPCVEVTRKLGSPQHFINMIQPAVGELSQPPNPEILLICYRASDLQNWKSLQLYGEIVQMIGRIPYNRIEKHRSYCLILCLHGHHPRNCERTGQDVMFPALRHPQFLLASVALLSQEPPPIIHREKTSSQINRTN